jgi:hypothetical protein
MLFLMRAMAAHVQNLHRARLIRASEMSRGPLRGKPRVGGWVRCTKRGSFAQNLLKARSGGGRRNCRRHRLQSDSPVNPYVIQPEPRSAHPMR